MTSEEKWVASRKTPNLREKNSINFTDEEGGEIQNYVDILYGNSLGRRASAT